MHACRVCRSLHAAEGVIMPVVLQIHDKPEGSGGISRVVAEFAAGLKARGWRVVNLRLARHVQEGAVATRPGSRALAGDAGLVAVKAAVRDVDAVILHLGFSLLTPDLVRAAAAVPLFVQLHDVSPFCPNGLRLEWSSDAACERVEGKACLMGLCAGRGKMLETARAAFHLPTRRAVWAALCERAVGFLVPSRYLEQAAIAAGAHRARVHLVPHPVEMGEPADKPASHGHEISYVGRLSAAKGAPLALEAVARLPGVTLSYYGDGPEFPALRERASRADLAGRVHFAGAVGQQEVRAGLLKARALVHPSLVPEGLGLAGIEAMALGRPVVGFGRGGSADWLQHEVTGLVCAPSPEDLAKGLQRVMQDPPLADSLGGTAQVEVRKRYAHGPALDALAARLAHQERQRYAR